HALGQLDVGNVQHCTTDHFGKIDLDGLGQIGRQAGDFDFGGGVCDDRRRQLHGRRDVAVDEVQRHLGGDGLRLAHALEVDVQNLLLVGVPLHRTQQYRTGRLAVDDEVENGGVILFL